MANKIEILVEVDPNGRGAAGIKSITANVETLGKTSKATSGAGGEFLSGFAGAVGLPLTIGAVATAIIGVGNAALGASRNATKAFGILEADAKTAKLSLGDAKEQAKKLGDELALSETQAQKTFAQFLRVVNAAGETKNIDKYRKNFQDLVAQYGLAGEEIETLTSQLLSGQDEALNRLGIKDPSGLYKDYAKQIGKTVEQLTEEEKVRARLLAITEKGEQFAGAAQNRLNSNVGQWEQLTKAISDSTTSLGKWIESFTLYQYLVRESRRVLNEGYFTAAFNQRNIEQDRIQQEKNRKTLEVVKNENARIDQFLKDNAVEDNSKFITDPVGVFRDANLAKNKDAFIAQYEALFKDKRLNKTTLIFAQEQFENIKDIFSTDKRQEFAAGLDKLFQPFATKALGHIKRARDAAESGFSTLGERYAGGANPFVKIFTEADENARRLEKTFGFLGDKVTREMRRVEEAYTKQRILGLQLDNDLKAASLRREANRLQNPTGLSGGDERRLSELNARINAATNTASLMATAEAIANGLVSRRSVSGEELLQRQYAERRGREFETLTEEEKFLATRGRDKEIEKLNKNMAFFMDSGLNIDSNKLFRDTFRDLQNLIDPRRGGGEFGRQAESAVNDALVNYFNSLGADVQARIATGAEGAGTQNTFAAAFRGQAEELQNRIKDEIDRAKVADEAIKAVRDDIATIRKAQTLGLDTRAADARLLAVTGALDPKELTGDVAQARIEALRREADAITAEQEEGKKATEKARESTDKLTTAIDALAKEVRNPQNRRLLIEIYNRARAEVRDELYGNLGDNE